MTQAAEGERRERSTHPAMKLLIALIVIGLAILAGLLAFAFWPTRTRAIPAAAVVGDKAQIEAGRYLAAASDCVACHTAPAGAPFAGGLPMETPIGAIYSTNITPDRDAGIGAYTLDQFDRAVRHGVRPDGVSLYPAMPFPSYARMTDADVAALYAYFMYAVPAVKQANKEPEIQWPLSMRWPLAIWRKVFAPTPDSVAFDPKRYATPEIARGAYLVQGPGHCGDCHTPRAATMQVEASDESGAAYLSGALIDGWVAINLRGDKADGLGLWSEQDIVDSLKTARTQRAAIVGPMGFVVSHSTQHLTDADLRATAAYLKTLAPSGTSVSTYKPDETTAKALQAGVNSSRGAELYVDNCAGCHRTDAQGYARVFPALAGNPTVLSRQPDSLVRMILAGGQMPAMEKAPSTLGMPGFAWRLNDADVATLATYVRSQWGNGAPAVGADVSARIRATLPKESANGK